MIARPDPNRSRVLRIAVPKGALYDESVRLLGAAGLDVSGLVEPGRQLMVAGEDVEYIIGRPTDVPVYVAYGAVDCAICGKDSLEEAGLDVAELVDLGFGGCRFVVAEPEDAADLAQDHYRHLGVIRVATKYPNVAERHFAAQGVQVEIVKLHGNIELAPLVGLAEQVLDVTATGRTLAENRLRVVDEVLSSTARFVANPVSMRTESARIADLAERLARAVSLQ